MLDQPPTKLFAVIIGGTTGVFASLAGGFALAQFVVAGIDPQLSDTYRQQYAREVADAEPVFDADDRGFADASPLLRDARYETSDLR
ncbi:MAG: hypothetical protein K2P79_09405 [Sphingomonas sp.]|nr:hypothetical protein [Sphingomonas sp.]